jgi:branched-chain amino acid transport system permease protein
MTSIDLALAGLSVGAVAALSGIGLLVTYRTNGVLNLGQGGIATLIAYVYREMAVAWHFPRALAAVVALAILSPGVGLLLERLVFRPLAARRASAAESLVASLGVLVLCLGITAGIWGLGGRSDTPPLFPTGSVRLPGGHPIGKDAIAALALVALACLALGIVTNLTPFGRQMRAVVDDRQLAELSAVDADRVSAVGWAIGTTLAGFTGILLAPGRQLNPYDLTLLVLETFAVVVAARLASMTVAVLTALAIGIFQSEMTQWQPGGGYADIYRAISTNLYIVVLLLLLLLLPRLRELGGDAGATGRFSSRGAPAQLGDRREVLGKLAGVALLFAPLTFAPTDLRNALDVPAFALIFLSLVIVTGYSGQISLGVAGYAGLGALLAAKLTAGDFFGLPALPGLLALFVGGLLVAPIGLVTGYPAIRRKGLALALTTFAVGAVVSRFVFEQSRFTSGLFFDPLTITFGDKEFYLIELACLGIGLLFVRNLHHGRLGRALLAVRDHADGAAAVGVDVRNLKLLSFTVSAAMAGLGGALLTLGGGTFDSDTFSPLNSLIWFTGVVVFGADSAAGAVAAAALIVTIDTLAGTGSSTLAIGILALALGWLPGGVAGAARGALVALGRLLSDETLGGPPAGTPRPPALVLSGPAAAGWAGTAANGIGRAGGGPPPIVTVNGITPTPFGAALMDAVRRSRAQASAPPVAAPPAASAPSGGGWTPEVGRW